MKSIFQFRLLIYSLSALIMAMLGFWFDYQAFAAYKVFLFFISLFLLGYFILKKTYSISSVETNLNHENLTKNIRQPEKGNNQPQSIQLSFLSYLKALVCWFDLFKRTYITEPGLYYTGGEYDKSAPLLVTSNFFLSVFLLLVNLRHTNARILVIDTKGINVWCSAGKGVFSSRAILDQINRYHHSVLTSSRKISLILPKFSLAGVNLQELRKNSIRPVIGPLYAKDLARYLANPPYKNCTENSVNFGLQSRLFSLLPGLVQFLGYSTLVFGILLIVEQIWNLKAPFGLIGLIALIATAYPVLFPHLPGKRFAIKSLWLSVFLSLGFLGGYYSGWIGTNSLILSILFIFASTLFFSLSYTGNSAVSNYSRVRKEIALFLPLNLMLYVSSLVLFIVFGV